MQSYRSTNAVKFFHFLFYVSAVIQIAAAASVSADLGGVTYVNKGIVAFGVIPADFLESTGDTIGGIGSGIAFKQGTWTSFDNGTYSGTLVVHPDSGPNRDAKVDYQSRQHEVDFVLKPYTGTTNLNFTNAQLTLHLSYKRTLLQVERNGEATSGQVPGAIRPADPTGDPPVPIVSVEEPHLTIDAESLVSDTDGTFWIGDEYGPYIYHFSSDGHLMEVVPPPRAFLPLDAKGNLNFTSANDPTTGRAVNQGFEGLALDATSRKLYVMMQSALIQDGGDDKSTSRFTRLLGYDVSDATKPTTLFGEWVVPLPQSSKGNTRASSEIQFVSPGVFLTLSRDADGRGGDDNKASYKQIDLFSISSATNILGTKFDDPSNPIADSGKLDKSIVPATYVSFVDMIDKDELARFGLHNGSPDDWTLIEGRWESLALAPVDDPAFPDDYFVFTASDNNFISIHGVSLGIPFDAGEDFDNQFLVFRVTLPSVVRGSVHRALGISTQLHQVLTSQIHSH